jgi:hypothetical protein
VPARASSRGTDLFEIRVLHRNLYLELATVSIDVSNRSSHPEQHDFALFRKTHVFSFISVDGKSPLWLRKPQSSGLIFRD